MIGLPGEEALKRLRARVNGDDINTEECPKLFELLSDDSHRAFLDRLAQREIEGHKQSGNLCTYGQKVFSPDRGPTCLPGLSSGRQAFLEKAGRKGTNCEVTLWFEDSM